MKGGEGAPTPSGGRATPEDQAWDIVNKIINLRPGEAHIVANTWHQYLDNRPEGPEEEEVEGERTDSEEGRGVRRPRRGGGGRNREGAHGECSHIKGNEIGRPRVQRERVGNGGRGRRRQPPEGGTCRKCPCVGYDVPPTGGKQVLA